MIRPRRVAGLALARPAALMLAAVLLSAPAAADEGVAVDVGEIRLDEPVQRGASHVLPTVGVRNPGTEVARYRFSVGDIESQRLSVPPSWVAFEPREFTLRPEERDRFEPTLTVPSDAEPGAYEALLSASIVGEGPGARVGAAAASRLAFTVSDKSAAGPGGARLGRWITTLGVLAAAGIMVVIVRRSGLRIRIERT